MTLDLVILEFSLFTYVLVRCSELIELGNKITLRVMSVFTFNTFDYTTILTSSQLLEAITFPPSYQTPLSLKHFQFAEFAEILSEPLLKESSIVSTICVTFFGFLIITFDLFSSFSFNILSSWFSGLMIFYIKKLLL